MGDGCWCRLARVRRTESKGQGGYFIILNRSPQQDVAQHALPPALGVLHCRRDTSLLRRPLKLDEEVVDERVVGRTVVDGQDGVASGGVEAEEAAGGELGLGGGSELGKGSPAGGRSGQVERVARLLLGLSVGVWCQRDTCCVTYVGCVGFDVPQLHTSRHILHQSLTNFIMPQLLALVEEPLSLEKRRCAQRILLISAAGARADLFCFIIAVDPHEEASRCRSDFGRSF